MQKRILVHIQRGSSDVCRAHFTQVRRAERLHFHADKSHHYGTTRLTGHPDDLVKLFPVVL